MPRCFMVNCISGGLKFFNSSLLIWVVFEFSQLVILLHNVLTVRGLDSKCFLVECRWGVLIYSSAHGVKSVKNYTPYMLLQYWWYGFVCTVLCFFFWDVPARLKGGWLKAFLGNWDFLSSDPSSDEFATRGPDRIMLQGLSQIQEKNSAPRLLSTA